MKLIKRIVLLIIIYLVFNISNVYAEELPEKFDLRDYINITVRDQRDTNTCWAFASTSLISTHLLYIQNESYTFSPRHMEYVMSENSIKGKENEYAYDTKKLDIGGNENVVKQYLIQGTGPILERNMLFENNSNPINESELPLDLEYKQVTEAAHILPMYKEWKNGQLIYEDYTETVISESDVLKYQKSVKYAIKKYGGIQATIAVDADGFNYSTGSFNTKRVADYWHAILLIGWDDNYSKDNFNEKVRPSSDGAYIALNSWGSYLGDDGYIYISYEDVSVDMLMKTYIKEVEDVDYDNVYYNDLNLAKQKGETLTELSLMVDSKITGYMYANLKVDDEYVIKNAFVYDCLENYVLETPVKLNENTKIELELMVDDEFKPYIYPYYYTVTNESQFESGKLSNTVLNGNTNELYLYTKHNTIDNNNKVDVKILKDNKDLTSKFNITGNIIKNNQTGITITSKDAYNGSYVVKLIYNNKEISHNITVINGVEELSKEDINKDNEKIEDKDKEVINNPGENNVKGDVSLDGKFSITDLAQLKAYIVSLIELNEQAQKIADVNSDGNITISDIAILKGMLVGKK